MRYGVGDSALKHGVAYGDVVHAARTGDYLGTADNGLMWRLGRDRDGEDLEVAGVATRDGAIVLVHAMPMKWRKR